MSPRFAGSVHGVVVHATALAPGQRASVPAGASLRSGKRTNRLGEGTSAGGGYLVPQGFETKMVEVRKSFGGLSSEVDTISTSTGQPLE